MVWLMWILFSFLVGALADSRGRSGFGYFVLSLILSPLVGCVVVLATKDLAEDEKKEQLRREEYARQLASINAIAARSNTAEKLPVDAAPGAKSVAEELAQFAELRDKGILTEEEFKSQKAALLRST